MSELLTKEKEFIKINQELDKTAATGHEKLIACKTDNRFRTFEKSKGPSTLLRKQGAAGDGYKQNSVTTYNGKESRKGDVDTCSLNNRIITDSASTSTQKGQPLHSSSLAQHRLAQSKCSYPNRIQQTSSGRVSTSRTTPPNNANFSIKYRNPNFLESPSLEVLVKEESFSLRDQYKALCVASQSSMQTDDGNPASGRQSQSSYQPVSAKKNISSEGLIKFLKSKIVILEQDHERLSQEMAQQKELFEKTIEQAKMLEQQRDQAKKKTSTLNEQLAKTEKQLDDANKLLMERNIEQNAQNKELETAKRDLKLLKQTNANLEKRLFRANEDLENVRKAVSEMKSNEREQREEARKDAEIKEAQIQSLKKQRANLLNAYKKQLFLIDNLKRQNVLLEQAKMLDIGEKEFNKVLDWDVKR